MIDKSIRQHYQTGEKVNQLTKWKDQLMAIPKKITPTSIAQGVVKRGLTKKLAGTGLLSSLGPIGTLLAMFLVNKGSKYASEKWGKGGVEQAFTAGMTGSPQEGKELRKLESRRQYMLRRKDEGKNYSEKNLDVVTRAIAEAKGLDINNPNHMKYIDKPIRQIQIERSITESPRVIPETPEIISPHLLGGDPVEDITTPPVWNPGIVAQEKAEQDRAAKEASDAMVAKEIAAAEAFRADKEKQEELARQAKAYAEAQAAKPPPQITQPTGVGNGGGQQQTGGGGYDRGDYGGRGYHWAKGGRIDKALGGRSRDIG